jgi:hypothetical protein
VEGRIVSSQGSPVGTADEISVVNEGELDIHEIGVLEGLFPIADRFDAIVWRRSLERVSRLNDNEFCDEEVYNYHKLYYSIVIIGSSVDLFC